jgi:hypothetical protein
MHAIGQLKTTAVLEQFVCRQIYLRFLRWMIGAPVGEYLRGLQGEKNYPFILIPLG